MQKRSHKLLASSLLRSHCGFAARRYELAFLFGSFQPDCNPFTFLRGTFRGRTLGGHNFSNSRPYISRKIRMLQQRDRWNILQYYTLGKLTHYLADAFTFPHNDHDPAPLMNHHRYEAELRVALQSLLNSSSLLPQRHCRDLTGTIDRLHRQYASAESSVSIDIHYILHSTCLLMTLCPPALSHP